MGLAGMFCFGGRNAEAAGLNFGDVRLWQDISDCWVAWIYKTTTINRNDLQSSGKSRNADRVVLLPDRYVQLVLERKAKLQELLGPDVNIEDLPVACRGNDFFTRCSADDLTAAAKKLFKRIKLPMEQIDQVYEEIQATLAEESDPLQRMNSDVIEKEPTAYFLRRVFGTSLACVDLSDENVAFQIGHDLGATPEFRNELLNTERLLAIKQRMNMRPIVNSFCNQERFVGLPEDGAIRIFPESNVTYCIPAGEQLVVLHLETKEPIDAMRVCISTDAEQKGRFSTISYGINKQEYDKSLDVTTDYHRFYNV